MSETKKQTPEQAGIVGATILAVDTDEYGAVKISLDSGQTIHYYHQEGDAALWVEQPTRKVPASAAVNKLRPGAIIYTEEGVQWVK